MNENLRSLHFLAVDLGCKIVNVLIAYCRFLLLIMSVINASSRLFVSGLSNVINKKDIADHFSPFGAITDIFILQKNYKQSNSNKYRGRGCAFVGFINESQATHAKKKCNATYLGTRKITVQYAIPKKEMQMKTNTKPFVHKNDSNDKEIEEDPDYAQFVRLSKNRLNFRQATANPSTGQSVIDEFLQESDSDSDSDSNTIQSQKHWTNDKKIREIFVRNLPFSSTDEDLFRLFTNYGSISEISIAKDDFNKSKGYALVTFEEHESVQQLFTEYKCDKKSNDINFTFQGRNIQILLSENIPEDENMIEIDDEMKARMSYKQLKELRMKNSSKSDINWNTLFIPTANVLKHTSNKLFHAHVIDKKSQLLGIAIQENSDGNDSKINAAINTTLAETAIISQTKQFLMENGINVDGCRDINACVRSQTTILCKNFSFDTQLHELRALFSKFGELNRILLPETKALCIVEYNDHRHARKAFHALAYAKFKQMPLFLEFAPINIFYGQISRKRKRKEIEIDDENEVEHKNQRSRNLNRNKKLIVKNVAFEANAKELRALFNIYGKISSLRLPQKNKFVHGNHILNNHRGFCFIEFETEKEAEHAFQALNHSHFYGRRLVLQWANKLDHQSRTNSKRTKIE